MVWRVLRLWWDGEMWWCIWCPGVDAVWTGKDLSIRLVTVVEWRGVLAHGGLYRWSWAGGRRISRP